MNTPKHRKRRFNSLLISIVVHVATVIIAMAFITIYVRILKGR